MQSIDSIKDPAFELFRECRTQVGRNKFSSFLIEEEEMILQAFEANFVIPSIFFMGEKPQKLCESLKKTHFYKISEGMMRKVFSGKIPSICAVAHKKEHLLEDFAKAPLLLILDEIQNCNNLGMILRSAEAFGVSGIIITSIHSTDLYNRNSLRGSMGSFFRVPLCCSSPVETIDFLKSHKITIVSTNLSSSKDLEELNISPPLALVVGNETDGISPVWENASDWSLKISMTGKIQSLNVAIASSICLHFLYQNHFKKRF